MNVQVLFFSVLQDIVGTDTITIDLSDLEKPTLDGLLSLLFDLYPDLKSWDGRLLLAIDQSFAERDDEIHDGAEVAIMPPVQGG